MNLSTFKARLAALGASNKNGNHYTLFVINGGVGSTVSIKVYLYPDESCFLELSSHESPGLYMASEKYETDDYNGVGNLLSDVLACVEQLLNEGVECSVRVGVLFATCSAKSFISGKIILESTAFKYGGFNLPKRSGSVGVFNAISEP